MKLKNCRLGCSVWIMVAMFFILSPGASIAANNVHIYGALVAEPCVIPPGKENISLDFGNIVDKYLYKNQRTLGQPFVLELADCDLSLGKTVSVNFQGVASAALPGLLAVNGAGSAAGIAIGLESNEGELLILNKASDRYWLQSGNNRIELKAYVQGEPLAIAQKSITHGTFNSMATFILEYE